MRRSSALLGTGIGLLTLLVANVASAAIGVTECASADGKLRRAEQEVWGANPVIWSYDGEILTNDRVKIDQNASHVVSDSIRRHPEMGDEHTLVVVEEVTITLQDGREITTSALCRTVEYPGVLD